MVDGTDSVWGVRSRGVREGAVGPSGVGAYVVRNNNIMVSRRIRCMR